MKPFAIAFALFLSGCSFLPSGWRFSTPITRQEKAEARIEKKSDEILGRVQGAVYQVGEAIQALPESREKSVALDFNTESRLLLDQTLGAPKAGDVLAWQKKVADLLSTNVEIRARAEAERRAALKETARLADELANLQEAKKKADEAVTKYAKENEALADTVKKLLWAVGALGGAWVLSQVLSLAARFIPALAPISAAVHAVTAPAISYALNRAQTGLQKVGSAIAEIRAKEPEVAASVTKFFDDHLDTDHKATVSQSAALKAHELTTS